MWLKGRLLPANETKVSSVTCEGFVVFQFIDHWIFLYIYIKNYYLNNETRVHLRFWVCLFMFFTKKLFWTVEEIKCFQMIPVSLHYYQGEKNKQKKEKKKKEKKEKKERTRKQKGARKEQVEAYQRTQAITKKKYVKCLCSSSQCWTKAQCM